MCNAVPVNAQDSPHESPPVWMTTTEAAQRARVSEWTVRQYIRTGRLCGYRLGGVTGHLRVRTADVDALMIEVETPRRRA